MDQRLKPEVSEERKEAQKQWRLAELRGKEEDGTLTHKQRAELDRLLGIKHRVRKEKPSEAA